MSRAFRGHVLVLSLLFGLLGAACSGDSEREDGDGDSAGDGDGDGGVVDGGRDGFDNPTPTDGLDGGLDGATRPLELVLEPDAPTLRVVQGEDLPTLQFEVKDHGTVVPAIFRVDSGELGRIDDDGLFTPAGTRGGQTLIEARVGQRVLHTLLTIEVEWVQNGADPAHPVMTSSGGYGGVGGEGPGGPVSKELKETLTGDPTEDPALAFLYPYDQTVFPLEMLAPLLMWQVGEDSAAADGIALRLSGSNFEYTGYFGRPEPLAADADFVRHPIPQEVWESATRTVAGSALEIELSIAKGDKLYGPIKRSLKIARGALKGTVYYQSYGTHLAKNEGGAQGPGDGRFGGATLAIKPGAIEPELVAGGDGGADQCRVCHSVSSDGSRMTVQHGDEYDVTAAYDLLNANAESGYAPELRSQLGWIGLTPDGNYGLANGQPLGMGGDPITQLYDMESGAVVPTTGLENVREAAFPAFAHDGRKVAFNFYNGVGDATIGMGDGKKLIGMDFDPMTNAFDNAQVLYEGDVPAGWPSFSPSGTGVIYQVQLEHGDAFFHTRKGGKGELWWTSLVTGGAHRLDRANGIDELGDSYLPKADNNHQADEVLNYEPTVAPVASGGYVWVVFTSRRLYGNVATIDPWFSDPREHDLTATATTKKLWVAAIELDVATEENMIEVGDDPSHPAFYLPGQELFAGNARGFWVVDPCKDDGKSCESGVECCSGYCQEDDSGELSCGRKTDECSEEFNRCDTTADCCDPEAACVNHVCSMLVVE